MNDSDEDRLARIEQIVSAMLMMMVREAQRDDEQTKVKPRSIEGTLLAAGLTQAEITRYVNKSKGTVSGRLKAEGLT